jgi:single-stranded-DNA-specific exonuclease
MKRGRKAGIREAFDFDLRQLLDLVALATIADVVPLVGENRILVMAGLARLNQTSRPGLLALMEVAEITTEITAYEAGFQLAPRLNAAGRLEDALEALNLLLCKELEEARAIARRLDAQNRERQRIGREILEQAVARAKARSDGDFVIVDGHTPWHIGVVGIVAARLLQEFYRPVIIFGGDGEKWRGSGRSIDGFDLAQALRECSELLIGHGGHAMAAGLSIKPDNIELFRERINAIARSALTAEQLQPALRLDAQTNLEDLTLEGLAELGKLQQTGIGNPPAQFFAHNLEFHRPPKRMGQKSQHAKFWVTDGKTVRESVWWNAGEAPMPEGRFDLAFAPQLNHFNGSDSVQLRVLDWRPAAQM